MCMFMYVSVNIYVPVTTENVKLSDIWYLSFLCFTCSSYGMKAMLISFSVFMRLATSEWHNSLNNSSGHAVKRYT